MGKIEDYTPNDINGVHLFALHSWLEENGREPMDDSDRMIKVGRMQAYSLVMRLITGRYKLDDWLEFAESTLEPRQAKTTERGEV